MGCEEAEQEGLDLAGIWRWRIGLLKQAHLAGQSDEGRGQLYEEAGCEMVVPKSCARNREEGRTYDKLDDDLVLEPEVLLRLLGDPRSEDLEVDLLQVDLLREVVGEGCDLEVSLVLVGEAAVVLDLERTKVSSE